MAWQDKFDSWTLAKGRDYFQRSTVDYLDKDNNVFKASVHGSDDYNFFTYSDCI